MVTSFPRANLDPASDEWRRHVEKLIREALGGASKARREVRAYGSGQAGVFQSVASQAAVIAEQQATVEQHTAELAPSEAPGVPTVPQLSTSLGAVVVAWDGLLIGEEGEAVPPSVGFKSVYAEILASVSTVEDPELGEIVVETWEPVGQPLSARGGISLPDLEVGSEVTIRLVAKNRAGAISSPSNTQTITVEGVVAGQITEGAVIADNIAANAVGTTQLVHGAVTREILAAQAVGPNEIADFAITARKFNTSAHILY